MRICIFTETFYPVVGGGETQALALAEGLVQAGMDAMVLTRRSSTELKKFEQIGAIKVYRLAPSGSKHTLKWGLLFSSIPALVRLRKEYDLIFVSGFRVIGLSAVLVSRLFGKACVLKADNNGEMSGSFFTAGMAKFGISTKSKIFAGFLKLRNHILRGATCFVAISSDLREEYLLNGVNASKVYYIPNSVDIERFHPVDVDTKYALREKLALPKESKLVIFTGRLVSYKGLPLLLEVWKELQQKHSEAVLLLVGSGSMDIHNCEGELRDYVQAQRLDKSVIFTGEVRNVDEYLQAADIFVFPTEKEAFGISVIEAMACGLPVIATSVGGLKDILQDIQNGLIIKPGDEQGLYYALEKLIMNKEFSHNLGQAALVTAKGSFSTEIVNRKYENLFRQMAIVASV